MDRRAEHYVMPELAGEKGAMFSAQGLRLVDEAHPRGLAPLRDLEGECYCSMSLEGVDPGRSFEVYAKFPAPPAGVDRVSLHVPTFPSFDDLAIG